MWMDDRGTNKDNRFFLTVLLLGVENDTVIFGLEPLHGVVLDQAVGEADGSGAPLLVADVHAGAAQHDVKVHAVNTNVGVVFDAQVDVFLDTEAKVTVVGKVFAAKLELAHLKSAFKDFFGLGPPDSAVNGNLLVPPDSEGSDGVPGLGVDWSLTGQGFEHLTSTSQPISRLADANVDAQL